MTHDCFTICAMLNNVANMDFPTVVFAEQKSRLVVLCQWASAESGKKKGAVSASATDGGLLSKVTVVF